MGCREDISKGENAMRATNLRAGPLEQPAPAAPKPSEQLIARANQVIRTMDGSGRQIGSRRMSVLESARFFELLGPDNSRNEAFLALAVPAYLAVEIDGEPMHRPMTRRELDARMQLLDEAGIEAVNGAIIEHWGAAEAASGDDLKNERGTQA
jgi:hypothetical protein